MRGRAALAFLVMAAGCGERAVDAEVFGERAFSDPKVSTSPFNRFSCATCHVVRPGAPAVVPGRNDPGYNLAGSVSRPSWWGGYAPTVLDAMNVCVEQFMGGRALRPDDDIARQLYAYLDAKSPLDRQPAAPLTIVRFVTALPGVTGDAARGRAVYRRSCERCHGAAFSGSGRLGPRPSVVPGDTVKQFPTNAREVVIEKVRHGRFFNIGGVMPLYSTEAMSDAELGDLLAYLRL